MKKAAGLLAVDVDGTLITDHGSITGKVYDALEKAVSLNWEVVIASGRTFFAAKPIIEKLPFLRYAVMSNGACIMVGGKKSDYQYLEPLFKDLVVPDGVQHFEGIGAGHFVKMVHNGIEYGMMQALAEGFTILKKSDYQLDLSKAAEIYNHGSVIESRLVGWLEDAFKLYSQDLKGVSGKVKHSGEGEWTVQTAKELKLKAKIIEGAFDFRVQSEKNPSYTGKISTVLRNQFGGHSLK